MVAGLGAFGQAIVVTGLCAFGQTVVIAGFCAVCYAFVVAVRVLDVCKGGDGLTELLKSVERVSGSF